MSSLWPPAGGSSWSPAGAEQATAHFGPFGAIMTLGLPPLSSDATRELLDWKPECPGLLADLDEGHYFAQ